LKEQLNLDVYAIVRTSLSKSKTTNYL